jgi:hypothetical protein
MEKKKLGRKFAYGDGVETTSMRVPKGRVDFVRRCLALIPADVDDPLEYLNKKTLEIENLLKELEKQIRR